MSAPLRPNELKGVWGMSPNPKPKNENVRGLGAGAGGWVGGGSVRAVGCWMSERGSTQGAQHPLNEETTSIYVGILNNMMVSSFL